MSLVTFIFADVSCVPNSPYVPTEFIPLQATKYRLPGTFRNSSKLKLSEMHPGAFCALNIFHWLFGLVMVQVQDIVVLKRMLSSP